MKKNIVKIMAMAFVAGALFLTACKKEDLTAPVITLTGGVVAQSLPTTAGAGAFTDQGATAEDDEDGNISANITVTGTVDPNRSGTYTLTYTVSDAAGNTATATRIVTVYNDADAYEGTYANSVDTCTVGGASAFSSMVTASDSVNGLIKINNFGAFGAAINIWATISGTTITIATNQSLGNPAYIQNVYPSPNTMVINTSAPTKFKVNYQWNDGTNSDVCTSTYIR
jgi:hypothetical protein